MVLFMHIKVEKSTKTTQCTEVRFASFLSGGFTTMAVINPPEKKLAKRKPVHCKGMHFASFPSCGVNTPERKVVKRISVQCFRRFLMPKYN